MRAVRIASSDLSSVWAAGAIGRRELPPVRALARLHVHLVDDRRDLAALERIQGVSVRAPAEGAEIRRHRRHRPGLGSVHGVELQDHVGATRRDPSPVGADQKIEGLVPPESTAEKTAYKFKRDFTNNEVLQVMEDFLLGKKLASGK